MNSDAMNIGVHVSFLTSVSSVYKSAFILDMLSFAFSSALYDGHPPILSVANGNPSSASVKKKKKRLKKCNHFQLIAESSLLKAYRL